MARHPFDPVFDALPSELPIFPLTGALLLPGGALPLNIFEIRYLNMVAAALGQGRAIGMIQPRLIDSDVESPKASDVPVYEVGCMGRITAFQETDDGRFTVNLRGLIRFAIDEELTLKDGYRRVRPDYSSFRDDLENRAQFFSHDPTPAGSTSDRTADRPADQWIDRVRLIGCVKNYFETQKMSVDWEAVERSPDDVLVTTLASVCPFSSADQQALLESRTIGLRAKMLIGLIEASVLANGFDRPSRH
ncbi:MAG: LON peptidase substrate-binding domain-containing protein [Alphaproteobacteria bacterium]|nr:LON peptidase substrate-binding domain-containing protein [Alphaproteobacteria bacterium]